MELRKTIGNAFKLAELAVCNTSGDDEVGRQLMRDVLQQLNLNLEQRAEEKHDEDSEERDEDAEDDSDSGDDSAGDDNPPPSPRRGSAEGKDDTGAGSGAGTTSLGPDDVDIVQAEEAASAGVDAALRFVDAFASGNEDARNASGML